MHEKEIHEILDQVQTDHLFMENRVCRTCGMEKSLLADFYKCRKDHTLKSSYSYECKECTIHRVKKNYHNDPSISQNNHLKRSYGITLDDYNKILTEQKNRCAICGTDKVGGKHNNEAFMVDHCHDTGKVRGLLCNQCNRGIGNFNDDVDRLRNAAVYLERNK